MENITIEVYQGRRLKIRGFVIKEDTRVLIVKEFSRTSDEIIYVFVTSLTSEEYVVWRQNDDSIWESSVEDDCIELLTKIVDNYELDLAVRRLQDVMKNEVCVMSDCRIEFTDVVPGEKSRDGGEYGKYTFYSPIPGYPGIFTKIERSSCDMIEDYITEKYTHITLNEYMRLREIEANILEEGCKY